MNLEDSMNSYWAERNQRVQAGQDLQRINNFDRRFFSSILNNMPLSDYMKSMDNMIPATIELKARLYVLWVFTLGNYFMRQEKFWSSLEWYEWWCRSGYIPNRDEKWDILRALHGRINHWITQIQPSFALQLSQPEFFDPPMPEIFYSFRWSFDLISEHLSNDDPRTFADYFFKIDELLRRRATLAPDEKVQYAEEIVDFFSTAQNLDTESLHGIDPLDLEEEGKVSDLQYERGDELGFKEIYFNEARMNVHKKVQMHILKWTPEYFSKLLQNRPGRDHAKHLAYLEVCRSYSIDHFGCLVSKTRMYEQWEYFRGLDSNTVYWYIYYYNVIRRTGRMPTPLGVLGPAIQALQAACDRLLLEYNEKHHLEWKHEPTYEYWSRRRFLDVHVRTNQIENLNRLHYLNRSEWQLGVPKMINPININRDKWLRLQKRKWELQEAGRSQSWIRQVNNQMYALERFRRLSMRRQQSQPSAVNIAELAEAETSSEDESMPDFDPPRTQLRF